MNKARLSTIFLIVFVDLLGFGLILPLLPYYAMAYGANYTVIGLLVASYAAAQFIGAPILGRLSDRYGRRPILLVSIFGTAIGFLLLATAEPLGRLLAERFFADIAGAESVLIVILLFVSRILDGLTGGNISVAQAYIADITDEQNRAQGLGLIGAAFGLGFIIGPAAGGTLSVYGYAVPAYVAAALASINLIAVYIFLPESLTPERKAIMAKSSRSAFSIRALSSAFRRSRVGPLLNIRFFFGLAFSMFQTIFTLYAAGAPLNLSAQGTGYVLTYVGVLVALVQGIAVGRLAARFDEYRLIFYSAILMALSLLGWAFADNLVTLMIILAPLALAGGVLSTVINSALSKVVHPDEIGGILGISTSLESLTRVIAPTVGGYMLGQFGAIAPGLFSTLIMVGVVIFAWRRLINNPDPPDNSEQIESHTVAA